MDTTINIQINFTRTFHLIDKKGQVINSVLKKLEHSKFSLNSHEYGLDLQFHDSKMVSLSLDTNHLNMQFEQDCDFVTLENLFWQYSNIILNILSVDEVSRLGFRLSTFYTYQDESESQKTLKAFNSLGIGTTVSQKIKVDEKDIALSINLNLAKSEKATDNYQALLLDFDTYTKTPFKIKEFQNKFKHIKSFFQKNIDLVIDSVI